MRSNRSHLLVKEKPLSAQVSEGISLIFPERSYSI